MHVLSHNAGLFVNQAILLRHTIGLDYYVIICPTFPYCMLDLCDRSLVISFLYGKGLVTNYREGGGYKTGGGGGK